MHDQIALNRSPVPVLGGQLFKQSSQSEQVTKRLHGMVRHELHLGPVPIDRFSKINDNMILDWQNGTGQSGFGHPSCKGAMEPDGIIHDLSKDFPTGPGQKQR